MKKNKKLILICIIIVSIIVGMSYIYYRGKTKESDIKGKLEQGLKLSDKDVEYGDRINFVDENSREQNYKVYVDNKEITDYSFDKIGKVEITEVNDFYYKNFLNKTKKVEVKRTSTYTVKDTKKPIIDGVSNKQITVGESIDLKEGVTARDEIDGNLEVIVEGNVDTNAVGEYNIKLTAKDRNGNTSESSYIVTVNNKPEVRKEETKNNSKSVNKPSSNSTTTNSNNSDKSSNEKSQNEQTTYNYETYGNKLYFEDRGENGNYGEKFTW